MTIDLPSESEEPLVRVLCEAGALGVQISTEGPLPPGRAVLHAYFEAERPLPGREELLRLCPGAAGMKILSTRAVADERWVERWIASLDPFEIGSRFRVEPVVDAEEASPPEIGGMHGGDGRIVLRIVPGRAFGTGEHATTCLCLEALERLDPAGRSLLDVGTGSGILAIAAIALGFAGATGIDLDPEAIRVARSNAQLNGIAHVIDLHEGTAAAIGGSFDVVVANLNSGVIEASIAELVAAVAPGGTLILSGLLEVEASPVAALAARHGAGAASIASRDGWSCAVMELPGA
jgi:ribosomal protein L11 methyltransferase